ncbi:hypothetical protein A3J36_02290 [Candidatus Uhrbacteria bacterium RIFCSPLOWO2_02_FULL_54_37]|uniref:indole-3-glycerol-phosphate synthase n=1 Tax=Candidatus Uhrbacteria bacterium RIFCSPLOWO2_02_FULL_54_37 TaxID=1802412 RepID=A0A1F7VJZ9_9BACT|nr:MAG: hypothetical protein A3J36_02290 [Candidatus Uhrbacteria bacterium RIFCSPLOWO2_02_FULL_54_37]
MKDLEGFLGTIYPVIQEQVARALDQVSLTGMKQRAAGRRLPIIDARERLVKRHTPMAVIAEIKRASPSIPLHQLSDNQNLRNGNQSRVKLRSSWCGGKGAVSDRNTLSQVQSYVDGGAAVISVLTEPSYFKGSLEEVVHLKEGFPYMPFLRKDFIINEYQIYESKAAGADMLLLITRWLTDEELKKLYQRTREVGLHALVEVETEEDLQRACAIGADIIGINARNLIDLSVDVNRVTELVRKVRSVVGANLPRGKAGGRSPLLVGESGVDNPEIVHAWHEAGVGAVLVGTALMRSNDPAELIKQFSMV